MAIDVDKLAKICKALGASEYEIEIREFVEMEDTVNVKSLDNRASVFVLLEALRKLKSSRRKPAYDLLRCVHRVGRNWYPRGECVRHGDSARFRYRSLDITLACDTPGVAEHKQIARLGDGAAIKVMDSSCVCDYRMVKFMKKTATAKKRSTGRLRSSLRGH